MARYGESRSTSRLYGKTVVQFVVGGVLPEIRILRMLKRVNFVEEFKVKLAAVGDGRIVGIEGRLRGQRAAQTAKRRADKEHPSRPHVLSG